MTSTRRSFVADSREPNLWWSTSTTGKKIAYFRRVIAGKDKWQTLGEVDRDTACLAVRKLRKEQNTEALLQKLELLSPRPNTATIGELLAAFDVYTAGADIAAGTAKNYKNCLKRIVAVARGLKGDAIGAARVALLTPELLRDYKAATIAGVKAEIEAEKLDAEAADRRMATAQRTMHSTAQQARALLSREALASAAYRALALPDFGDFLNHRIGESTIVRYQPLAAGVMAGIVADAAALRTADGAVWLALMLIANSGIRRGSAVDAKWDWFTVIDPDHVELSVRRAKGGQSRIAFPAEVYRAMLDKQDGPTYVLPGAERDERDEVCARLVAWLRARGLEDTGKPLHALRGHFLDSMRAAQGISAAQAAAGHSTPALTSKVYSQARTEKSLRIV